MTAASSQNLASIMTVMERKRDVVKNEKQIIQNKRGNFQNSLQMIHTELQEKNILCLKKPNISCLLEEIPM